MKLRPCLLPPCAALCAGAALLGTACGQPQGDVSAAAPPHIPETQVTPAPPRIVPFGTAYLEYQEALRRQISAVLEERASAVREGKSAEVIRVIDARIDALQRRVSSLQGTMQRAGVPETPPTPPPHSRAVLSTNP